MANNNVNSTNTVNNRDNEGVAGYKVQVLDSYNIGRKDKSNKRAREETAKDEDRVTKKQRKDGPTIEEPSSDEEEAPLPALEPPSFFESLLGITREPVEVEVGKGDTEEESEEEAEQEV